MKDIKLLLRRVSDRLAFHSARQTARADGRPWLADPDMDAILLRDVLAALRADPAPAQAVQFGCYECKASFSHEPLVINEPGCPAVTYLFCSPSCRLTWSHRGAVAIANERAAPAPTIDCPVCGKSVPQVSSATLSLALWQHFNWMHRGAAPAPDLEQISFIMPPDHEASSPMAYPAPEGETRHGYPDQSFDLPPDLFAEDNITKVASPGPTPAPEGEMHYSVRKTDNGWVYQVCDSSGRECDIASRVNAYEAAMALAAHLSPASPGPTPDQFAGSPASSVSREPAAQHPVSSGIEGEGVQRATPCGTKNDQRVPSDMTPGPTPEEKK
jgi:hypothetical protein